MQPQTRYARSGDVHIAYQVVGDGPIDLVLCRAGSRTRVRLGESGVRAAFRAARVLLAPDPLRQAGHGPVGPRAEALPTLEERMDDVRAVMDAAGSERACLFGVSEGGPMACCSPRPIPSASRRSDPLRLRASNLGAGLPIGLTRRSGRRSSTTSSSLGRRVSEVDCVAPSLHGRRASRSWFVALPAARREPRRGARRLLR